MPNTTYEEWLAEVAKIIGISVDDLRQDYGDMPYDQWRVDTDPKIAAEELVDEDDEYHGEGN